MTPAVMWAGMCFALAVMPGCWYLEPCPDDVAGVKGGEQLETKIIAPHASVNAAGESCRDLGDLAPDTTFIWTAHFTGSAETCATEVVIQPLEVSSGDLTDTSSWWTPPKITLPSGCTGIWAIRIEDRKAEAQLVGAADAAAPGWLLVRTFTPSVDATACPLVLNGSCTDSFVAETTRSEP